MKRFAVKIPLCMLFAASLIACDEPYTVDENADAAPVISKIIMRDALHDAGSANPLGDELLQAQYEWNGQDAVHSFNYPWIVMNKLLNGDTIEKTEKDAPTGLQLGQCEPQDRAVTYSQDGQAFADVRLCYSPSDRMISVQPIGPSGPQHFLAYESTYTVALGDVIKDKQGKALSAPPISFTIRPFEVLHVTNATGSAILYAAEGTTFGSDEITSGFKASSAVRTVIRVVFSGPVASQNESGAMVADASMGNMTLYDASGNIITGSDGKPASAATKVGSVTSAGDPRVVFIVPPQYTASQGKEGLPPGDYELRIPPTVTDTGEVTGAKVPLGGQELRVPFTILPN